jgi:uncharacterized protein YqeY
MKNLEDLKREALEARKNRDTFRAKVLTTLLADANTRAKNEQRDPTNDDLQKAAKYFMKNLEKSRDLRETQEILDEIKIIGEYLPEQTNHLIPIGDVIDGVLAENPDETNAQKLMGMVMKKIRGKGNPKTILWEIEKLLEKQ